MTEQPVHSTTTGGSRASAATTVRTVGETQPAGLRRGPWPIWAAVNAKWRQVDWYTLIEPPEVWSNHRPSLRDLAHHAWSGDELGDRATGHLPGRIYAVTVSIPAHAVGYLLLWLTERPARLAVGMILATLVALTPPGSWAIGLLADVARWVARP